MKQARGAWVLLMVAAITLVFLCVALIGRVAAVSTAGSTHGALAASAASRAGAVPVPVPTMSLPAGAAISSTAVTGSMQVTLAVAPPTVGFSIFSVTVRDGGLAVRNAHVRIRLSMPLNPALGATFVQTSARDGTYLGHGKVVEAGQWRALVMVRTRRDPLRVRRVGFEFVVGADAGFVRVTPLLSAYGPAAARLFQPHNAPDTLQTELRPGLQVRYLLVMPHMPGMGSGAYAATATGSRYTAQINFPMEGLTEVSIEVHGLQGWRPVRTLSYLVNARGSARPLVILAGDGITVG